MDRTLPTTHKLPWDVSAIESGDARELAAYLKKLLRELNAQYEDTANIVNIISSDITIGASADRPSAAVAERGKIYVTESGAGVADTADICLKSAGDTYSWVNLATG